MCGIFAYIQKSNTFSKNEKVQINKYFNTIKYRGPDHTSSVILNKFGYSIFLGFHRLAIIDIAEETNNLLSDDNIYLVCNGEIYNYKYLIEKYNLTPKTGSDCEVILQLYKDHACLFPEILEELDGVFAFVLYDNNTGTIYTSRDRRGVRPLFMGKTTKSLCFASEGKAIPLISAEPFPPGLFRNFDLKLGELTFDNFYWEKETPYFNTTFNTAMTVVKSLFIDAVKKRLMSDRPVGFLLSGGLDSSLVASIGSRLLGTKINTFSVGLLDSPDLKAAAKVAKYLDSNHHEIIISTNDIIEALPLVIYHNESYDITTTRASIPMYLLIKYIKENTDIKVIFSGEGADELFGGYLYFHKAPTCNDFQHETHRLLQELYKTDVLRADRMISCWGLEGRVPFLDADFVNYVSGLDPAHKMAKQHGSNENKIEKYLLRQSFEGYLPDEILWRQKEAFSDGVGKGSVEALKKYASTKSTIRTDDYLENKAKPDTEEAELYYNLFISHYSDKIGLYNDYYWKMKWVGDINDPSATLLSFHTDHKERSVP